MGQGVEPDESEAVQTVRKAKEFLNKLATYKPLVKEEENISDRISIKEKLAEKKAIIDQKDKNEKVTVGKNMEKTREM